MLIKDLKDKQTNVSLDLKIIYDMTEVQDYYGTKKKTIIVIDENNETSEPSAFLELKNEQIDKFKFQDKVKVTGANVKQSTNKKKQCWIKNGKIEKIN